MKKIIATEFVTLDGVMEDPGGSDGTPFGGWGMKIKRGDDDSKFKLDELMQSDALLMGRITYEGFAKAWPGMKNTDQFGLRMNTIPKYVVSETLTNPEWEHTQLISDDIIERISALKNQMEKDILVYGSADLLNSLFKNKLVDEIRLMVYPFVVGDGKYLFRDGVKFDFDLVDSKKFDNGLVLLTYNPKY